MADLKQDSPRPASEAGGSVATAQGTELFILGAGFSAAVNSQMPTLIAMTNELERLTKKPAQVNSLERNVEHWMAFLSQRQPWLSEADNLRNRAAFLDLANHVHSLVQERTSTSAVASPCPVWLADLVRYWHEHQSKVITLNYDTLVERAARQVVNVTCGQLYPPGLTDAGRRDQTRWAKEPAQTFPLLKLHGSANWYYSGSTSYEGETIYYVNVAGWKPPDQDERDGLLAVTDKVPLLIPPTTDKGAFFAHEAIKAVWRRAAEGVQSATRVFIIGYSCPQTDLGMEFFLRRNHRSGGAGVEVVDLNPAVVSRYQAIWPKTTGYAMSTNYAGVNGVSKFVSALVNGMV